MDTDWRHTTKPLLRAGLIGAGHISAQHVPAWVASPDADLVAICDLDRSRAEARRDQLATLGQTDVAIYTDVDAMLAGARLDCVDVATRPRTHRALIERAAGAGLHVLCQKPLAASLPEARAMVDATRAAGVRFMVTEMWRFLPWFRDLHRLVEEGAIGTAHYLRVIGPREPMTRTPPVHATQPYFAEMPRLIVYEMYIHWIDSARYLLGEITSVYARAGRVNPAIVGEDWAVLVLGHVGGATSVIESSWATPTDAPAIRREGDILLEGVDGALHFDATTLELRLVRSARVEVIARYTSLDRAFQSAFDGCIGHFAAALRHDQPFESPVEDNLRTLGATLAAYDSLEGQQAVGVGAE
ncbi:MAG TPA: Gfo/Idh/MocA family oxidoreductase [Chloroflexota bacterium]|nr:Gfo/Idh/MocA family oxidoreductase [Chloroflexota bacterium]